MHSEPKSTVNLGDLDVPWSWEYYPKILVVVESFVVGALHDVDESSTLHCLPNYHPPHQEAGAVYVDNIGNNVVDMTCEKERKMANTNPKRECRVSITWGNPVEVCCFDGPTWQSNNTSLACTEHGSWKWVRIRGWSVTQIIAVPFWHLTVWKSLLNVMCANFGWQL